MSVHDFEFYHGAALTKIMRSDRPITLRMIETAPSEVWSAYRLNDEVVLYVKHSANPRTGKRKRGSTRWPFTFTPAQLQQANSLRTTSPLFVALVCASYRIGKGPMEICLLDQEQLEKCIDLTSSATQVITVECEPGKSLRAYGPKNSKTKTIVVPRNRLETWQIPGN